MKTTFTISLIALTLLLGGCNSNQAPQTAQPEATAPPGQPVQSAQYAPPPQEVDASEEYANYPPPPLPVYDQPDCPGPGYIWTPGYWAWSAEDGDYYWVPGTWVLPPEADVLWTPGYWDYDGGRYQWDPGYWGSSVGYYGGVDYGYGYTGNGYQGGRWDHGNFYYNRAVNNVSRDRRIANVYDQPVSNQLTVNNPSFHGGRGGTTAGPSIGQRLKGAERHIQPTNQQVQHQAAARGNRSLRASENHGRPPIAATSRPGMFSGGAAVATRAAAPYEPPPQEMRGRNEPRQPLTQPGYEPRQPMAPGYQPRQQAAQPGYQPRPQEAQPRNEERPQNQAPRFEPHPQEAQPQRQAQPQQPRFEPHQQAAQPQRQAQPQQPRFEPHPQAAQPQHQAQPQRQAQPQPQRNEPHPQAAQPQHQAPPAAQPRSAPPPHNEPHPPEERPKEEH